MLKCKHCASLVTAGAKFCPSCGKPVEVDKSPEATNEAKAVSQIQKPVHVTVAGGTPPPPLPPAALADRVKASAIDVAVIFIGAWLIGQIMWVSAWTTWRFPLPFGGQSTTLLPWLPLLVAALYWFTEVVGGRSPGKRIAGVRVVTTEGGKPGFLVLKKRWMMKIGVFAGAMFLCMVLWQIQMGANTRSGPWLLNRLIFLVGGGIEVAVVMSLFGMRGLHDRMSGCSVARFDSTAAHHPAWTAGELHVKQLILKTPGLLLKFVKSASGIFDAKGKFSWKALCLYPVRMFKSKTRAFLQGAALGMIIHFSTVGLSGGYNDVAKFPTMLMVPTLSKTAPSSTFFFPVATALWGTVAAMFGFIIGVLRGGATKKPGTPPLLPGAGVAAGVVAFLVCEDLMADDSGLSEWGADPSRFAKEGGLNLVGQSTVVGAATGAGTAMGQTAGETVNEGLTNEEGPPGEGWMVTDADGNEHFFPTKEAADKYWQKLVSEQEAETEKEHTRMRQEDFKNTVEQIGFVQSIRDGLKAAGRDCSEQDREIERLTQERDRINRELAEKGASISYTAQERSIWRPDPVLEQMVQQHKEEAQTLQDIHKTAEAIRNLQEHGNLSYTEGQSEKMLEKLDKMSQDLLKGHPPSREDIEKIRHLISKEMDAESSRQDARDSNWVRDGAESTSREIFTGTNSDGETSYKAMVLRGLIGAATGGQSEYGMEIAEKMYGVHDDIMAGKSGMEAFTNAAGKVIFDEGVGRAMEKGLALTGKAAGAGYEATLKGTDFDRAAKEQLEKAGKFLNQDVKDLVGGTKPKNPDLPGTGIHGPSESAVHERTKAFEEGRKMGNQKVDDLEQAMKQHRDNPTPESAAKVRDKLDAVQQDKHAMQAMNGRTGDAADNVRKGFSEDLGQSYNQAHDAAKQRIAKEYGVNPDDVKVVQPTNKPGAVPEPDPSGFAKKPKGAPKTHGDDIVQTPGKVPDNVNPKKASFDQDVTYRVKQDGIDPRTGKPVSGHLDVPKTDAKRIYNEEFYKARHDGKLPYETHPDGSIKMGADGKPIVDAKKVNDYNHKMDQSVTDRLDAEAYGTGDKDLQTATNSNVKGRDFSDVEGVGKTMEHKQYEWRNEAQKMQKDASELSKLAKEEAAAGNLERAAELQGHADKLSSAAEGKMEEGFRQTTKQFKNQIQGRVDALNSSMGRNVANVPPKLQEAVGIMEQCGKPGYSPAEVERKLAQMGYTPEKVVNQMSSTLESLQKFKPSGLPKPPVPAPPGFMGRIIGQTATKGAFAQK
ncbi:RDD family protein [Prosthecobacter sp.]|uniref:RDD family protein n=1 Tax=Prosthecobacter sp. TaxID=1965333 RepID=UPI001D72CD22|nr:RDD family protein [Prosthecobacter sp.]MCB1278659.1 RDD family protein [Prosthecobacter sp.]